MAQFEPINFDGVTEMGINIRKIVGWAGADLEEDVMLLQTVFEYISIGVGPHVFGMEQPFKAEVRGYMDHDTLYALGEFQVKNAGRLLTDTFRRMHPASYKGRVIRNHMTSKLMTITYLHILAQQAGMMQGSLDYTQDLLELEPRLVKFIDKALIES